MKTLQECQETADSSTESKYQEKANHKDDLKAILSKHIKPLGIDMTSKFAQASLAAMREAAQFHKQALEDTWEAGMERGYHLAKCEAEGIHPDGRPGVPPSRHKYFRQFHKQETAEPVANPHKTHFDKMLLKELVWKLDREIWAHVENPDPSEPWTQSKAREESRNLIAEYIGNYDAVIERLSKTGAVQDTQEKPDSEVSQRVAALILKVRDAMAQEDIGEAYHALYQIASPNFDKTEPWKEIEAIAIGKPE